MGMGKCSWARAGADGGVCGLACRERGRERGCWFDGFGWAVRVGEVGQGKGVGVGKGGVVEVGMDMKCAVERGRGRAYEVKTWTWGWARAAGRGRVGMDVRVVWCVVSVVGSVAVGS